MFDVLLYPHQMTLAAIREFAAEDVEHLYTAGRAARWAAPYVGRALLWTLKMALVALALLLDGVWFVIKNAKLLKHVWLFATSEHYRKALRRRWIHQQVAEALPTKRRK